MRYISQFEYAFGNVPQLIPMNISLLYHGLPLLGVPPGGLPGRGGGGGPHGGLAGPGGGGPGGGPHGGLPGPGGGPGGGPHGGGCGRCGRGGIHGFDGLPLQLLHHGHI